MKKKLFILIFVTCAIFLTGHKKYNVTVAHNVSFLEIGDSSLVTEETLQETPSPITNVSALQNLSTLRQNYYAVDKKTGMTSDLFDVNSFLSTDLKIHAGKKPTILIFHTHAHEMFADSKDMSDGIIGAGNRLAKDLEEKYGIKCLHITDSFDTVNGKVQRDGAYERAEQVIKKVLAENPSIELVIDLHRDGVNPNLHLVTTDNGQQCAKVMFFNGLCKKQTNGKLQNIPGLSNPYIKTNLALSFRMQQKMNELYPNLTRKIYLNAYRYSLHMKDKSMLIELGAQTNTVEEINNSIDRLAKTIYEVTK